MGVQAGRSLRDRAAEPRWRIPQSVRIPALCTLVLRALLWAPPAHAYRPFDSTDADVTSTGEVAIEVGPADYVDDDGRNFLTAPDLVVNYGVYPRLEIVAEGRGLVPLEHGVADRYYQVVDAALMAKRLLRSGSLQGETGPSLALELGALVPTQREEPGLGGEGTLVVSHRFSQLTAHLSAATAYTRDHSWERGLGLILEGPAWRGVRPVLEGTLVREIDGATTRGGLVGLIWEARDDLALDIGFRAAREGDAALREIRAGFTWSFAPARRTQP